MTELIARRAEWLQFRHDLHQIPELAWQEKETQAYLLKKLTALRLSPRPLAQTGVFARLETGRPGPTLAFRADMDALAVTEATGLPFSSRHPGRMHACGHDFHMACLLSLATLLTERRDTLCGTVCFLFQPAEEGGFGAQAVVESGVLEGADAIFGLHIWDLPLGAIGIKPGVLMASAAFFETRITGVAGHGAEPHKCKNPIPALAEMVTSYMNTGLTGTPESVLSVCSVGAGESGNVIPAEAWLRGTIRTFDEALTDRIVSTLTERTAQVAARHGCTAAFRVTIRHAAVNNDPALAAWARDVLSPKFQTLLPAPSTIGEDFSCYQALAPSLFLWVGGGPCKLHDPHFSPNEDALLTALGALYTIAKEKLGRG